MEELRAMQSEVKTADANNIILERLQKYNNEWRTDYWTLTKAVLFTILAFPRKVPHLTHVLSLSQYSQLVMLKHRETQRNIQTNRFVLFRNPLVLFNARTSTKTHSSRACSESRARNPTLKLSTKNKNEFKVQVS